MKNSQAQTETAMAVISEWKRLSSDRSVLDAHCTEIAQRIWPSHSKSFQTFGSGNKGLQGEKLTDELLDSTAAMGLNKFGAILDSLLTPRNQTWHRMMVSNKHLAKNREVRLYFEEANQVLFKYRYAPKANFASQNQQNYKSLGAYGTGCIYVDELKKERGLRYKNVHLGQIYLVENHQGIIDKVLRHFPMTARQAVQKWGKENLPQRIGEVLEQNPEQEFFFIHCVKPREEVDSNRADYAGMEFASYYVSIEGQTLISEGGYSSFPYAVSRYEQSDNEVYGRSPAMDVLPAIKTLNEEKKVVLKQGHRTVDPVLLAHDDGVLDSFSMKPGFVNYGGVTADGRPLVHTLPIGNVNVGKDLMDDERQVINNAFLVTLFQILVETPQMTATEVLERTREKGILLAPTIGRQQSEYLGPLIERELDLLSRQRLLPPMPQILLEAQGEYRIEYDSPLSRAQRAEEASGFMRTAEVALKIALEGQNPAVLDHFDWDVIMPEIADIQGVPARWMRSLDQIKIIRESRAQESEQATAIQAAPAAAAMVKAVNQKPKKVVG